MLPIDCSDEVNDIITSFLINDLDTHSKLNEKTICKVSQIVVTSRPWLNIELYMYL